MQLRPKKYVPRKTIPDNVKAIMSSERKFITEEQLAEILGLNVQKAVIEAVRLKFNRIPVKNTRYYSKKQIQAYLDRL